MSFYKISRPNICLLKGCFVCSLCMVDGPNISFNYCTNTHDATIVCGENKLMAIQLT